MGRVRGDVMKTVDGRTHEECLGVFDVSHLDGRRSDHQKRMLQWAECTIWKDWPTSLNLNCTVKFVDHHIIAHDVTFTHEQLHLFIKTYQGIM